MRFRIFRQVVQPKKTDWPVDGRGSCALNPAQLALQCARASLHRADLMGPAYAVRLRGAYSNFNIPAANSCAAGGCECGARGR